MVTTTTVTRRTVTTGGGGTVRSATIIPLWTIKLITAVLSVVILILIFLQKAYWQKYAHTFIIIVLTCGFILGWSTQAVLTRFLAFYRVDVVLHSIIVTLTVVSTVLCLIFLFDQRDWHRTNEYSYMVGITVCMGVSMLICFLLIGCLWRGNYAIVDTH